MDKLKHFSTSSFNQFVRQLLLLPVMLCGAAALAAPHHAFAADTPVVDLTRAVVASPATLNGPEKKAVQVLIEEIEKRTQLRLPSVARIPAEPVPVIVVGTSDALRTFYRGAQGNGAAAAGGPHGGREGYRISVDQVGGAPRVVVAGNDSRGTLFGVGHLLRTLHLEKNRITLPGDFKAATAPRYALRGHQLGFRPKTNSYDGWTVAMWDQYIRDLAIFGTNAIELMPPRTDDAPDSPHFPLSQMKMMIEMSRIIDEYGLDVWIWYPALDKDYSDPQTVEFALKEWGEVFKQLPRIDAVMVPGGDPGHTQPKHLMALLEKQTRVLRQYHPRAQMWVSPQGFTAAWMDEFYAILKNEQPAWLTGIVFGPQIRVSLPQLRAAVPSKYPIRRYPDITHSRNSQYPVPEWDLAYALTEAREVINPRPLDQAHIFRFLQAHGIGFLTYSEGNNDDVNKFIWSGLGWDPEANVVNILRDYSRYFIGHRYTDDFAQGLLALERNWRGPLLTNDGVHTTLKQFQAMERAATPADLLNWRFQQALYRAYYDAYTRSHLLYETSLEERAREVMRDAPRTGSLLAMTTAEQILDQGLIDLIARDWRARTFELAEALYQSSRMQLSVERYKAISVGRGANLDTLDMPLNNRLWLKQKFAELRQLPSEEARLRGIREIVDWTNPGPGGFYDDLGDVSRQPHLVKGKGFEGDPAFLDSAMLGVSYRSDWPVSWWTHAETLHETPLRMRYTALDPQARYKIRVVYAGDLSRGMIRLAADENVEIHPLIAKPTPVRPVEYDIPANATADGELNLSWTGEPGRGGNGRGTQVAEVWLIKK